LKNPVLLFNHDLDQVLGKWEGVSIEGTNLYGTPLFDDRDPDAMKIFNKVDDELINCASIGITPLAWEGDMITECILKEKSITPLGANKNAVALYNQEGVKLSDDQARQYLLSLKPSNDPTKTEEHKEQQMNEKTKLALIALAVQLGITLSLSDSEEKFAEIATKAKEKIDALNLSIQADKEAKAKKLCDDAQNAGKITAKENPVFYQQALLNYEHTENYLNALKPVNLDLNNLLDPDKKKPEETTDERKDWTFSDWSKKDSAGLQKMLLSDKTRFKALYKAEYQVEYEG